MTKRYRCEDGHEYANHFAEIMPLDWKPDCPVCVPDPALHGKPGFMISCGKPMTLIRIEEGGDFTETYLGLLLGRKPSQALVDVVNEGIRQQEQ